MENILEEQLGIPLKKVIDYLKGVLCFSYAWIRDLRNQIFLKIDYLGLR